MCLLFFSAKPKCDIRISLHDLLKCLTEWKSNNNKKMQMSLRLTLIVSLPALLFRCRVDIVIVKFSIACAHKIGIIQFNSSNKKFSEWEREKIANAWMGRIFLVINFSIFLCILRYIYVHLYIYMHIVCCYYNFYFIHGNGFFSPLQSE